MDFKEIKVSDGVLNNRSKNLICGVATNDSDYRIDYKSEGVRLFCPYYSVWRSMIDRCYSAKRKKRQPTYTKCSTSKDWLLFINFKKWMSTQDWQGNQLDKDLLNPGNKIYSEENCLFVSREVNNVLIDCGANRGKYKQGVTFCVDRARFSAHISVSGKFKTIGYFHTESEAYKAYATEKIKRLHALSERHDGKTKTGLNKHIKIIIDSMTGDENE